MSFRQLLRHMRKADEQQRREGSRMNLKNHTQSSDDASDDASDDNEFESYLGEAPLGPRFDPPTDAERSRAIASKLVQAIDSEQLRDLRELLDKNQNACTGDGSFDSLTWTHLRDLRNALETAVFKYNVLRFSRPEQTR